MSATVFGAARYGVIDDSSATGLKLGSIKYAYSSSEAVAEDHTGSEFAMAQYNDMVEVNFDGVVAVKTAGMGLALADVVVLLNENDDTLGLNDAGLFTTADANAGVVVTSLDLSRGNKEFETGSGTGKYKPLIATNAPSTLS